jgi:hypothetical protein
MRRDIRMRFARPHLGSDTMKVRLFLQGEITPLIYDYDLDTDGVLIPSRRPKEKDKETLVIVLELGSEVPTKGQRETINNIRTINPTWIIETFYKVRRERGARK